MEKHIAYCWELGMGFGHVSRMDKVANDPSLRDCRFSFALREIHKAGLISRCEEGALFQAPMVNTQQPGASPNYSHMLARCGWFDSSTAISLCAAWRNLLMQLKPDLVLLDHAPSAGLAALTLGLPVRCVGNGFENPPVSQPMPAMQFHLPVDHQQLQQWDDRIERVFEQVERHFCGDLQGRLSFAQLFNAQHCLITGLPLLDHYGQRDAEWRYLYQSTKPQASEVDLSNVGQSGKPPMFFYLDARTENLPAILRPLSEHFELFGHLGYLQDKRLVSTLSEQGVRVYEQLLNIEQVFAKAEAVISNAGAGILSNVIEYAMPSIILPKQLEQSMMAYQMHQQQLAWVINPQQAEQQLRQYLPQWLTRMASLRQHIAELRNAPATTERLWQGNLYSDFLFTQSA